jgi:hypothetical protein
MSGSLPGEAIPDLIRQGLGQAGRMVGDWCDVFRPSGPADPLDLGNRFLRLPAAFSSTHGFAAPVGYGEALWLGYFDAAYARPGDYLSGLDGVFFIASQPRLGPVLCVLTNRTLSLSRPAGPPFGGVNSYVGVQPVTSVPLLTNWPASVLAAPAGGRGALPSDAPGLVGGAGGWSALLPSGGVLLRPGDIAQDDVGRTGVVSSAELTELGWRLHIRQAAV